MVLLGLHWLPQLGILFDWNHLFDVWLRILEQRLGQLFALIRLFWLLFAGMSLRNTFSSDHVRVSAILLLGLLFLWRWLLHLKLLVDLFAFLAHAL